MSGLTRALKNTDKQYLIRDLLQSSLKISLVCPNCGEISSHSEDQICLSLEVQGLDDLNASLQQYIENEIIEGISGIPFFLSIGYYCRSCNQSIFVEKHQRFTHLAPNLVFQLKRFGYDAFVNDRFKLQNIFTFPLSLDLSWLSPDTDTDMDINDYQYVLKAVIVHTGEAQAGHYTCFVMKETGKGYELNDERVISCTEEELISKWFGGEFVGIGNE